MDNITHTLIGIGMARSGLSDRFGRSTTLVLAVTSNITDIDVFVPIFTGTPSIFIRRMATHSIVGIPVLALLAAFIFRRLYPHISFKALFGLSLLGIGVHVFFDLLNSYGVVALWPFSHRRYELACVFIVDLLIWFLLLAPLFLAPLFRPWFRPSFVYRASLVALALYVCFCAFSRFRSGQLLQRWVEGHDRRPTFSYEFPEAFGGHRFRGVIKEGSLYTIFLINVLNHTTLELGTVQTWEDDPAAQACFRSDTAKQLMRFFKAPVWTRNKSTGHWEVYDLRFQSAVFGWKNPFVYELKGC